MRDKVTSELTRYANAHSVQRLVRRRRDARMDAHGHCTVCGCEVREYEGGSDEEAMKEHVCPEGFRVRTRNDQAHRSAPGVTLSGKETMENQSDDGAEKRGADSGAAPCSAPRKGELCISVRPASLDTRDEIRRVLSEAGYKITGTGMGCGSGDIWCFKLP